MTRYCSKVACWVEIIDGAYCSTHEIFAPTRKHRELKIDYKQMAKESQERILQKYATKPNKDK